MAKEVSKEERKSLKNKRILQHENGRKDNRESKNTSSEKGLKRKD